MKCSPQSDGVITFAPGQSLADKPKMSDKKKVMSGRHRMPIMSKIDRKLLSRAAKCRPSSKQADNKGRASRFIAINMECQRTIKEEA